MNQSTNFNLYSKFQQQFNRHPEKCALITEQGEEIRFEELEQYSAQLANLLTSLGLTLGDRVSVQVEKSPQCLCLYLACLRAGLVYHPLNTGYKASELEYFFADAAPKLVVCAQASVEVIKPLLIDGIQLLTLEADGHGSLMEQAQDHAPEFETVDSTADDRAALLYSSGTTGRPKGIPLSHGNLLTNAEALVEAWGFTEQDVLLHALPVFHVHGLFVAVSCALLSGASMHWLPAFKAASLILCLPECTVMMGVPTFYTRLLAEPEFDAELTKGMRLFVSGSAPLLAETFDEFEVRTGHRILERYGMTETGMNTSNPLQGLRKPGTVGPPLSNVKVRIVNEAQQAVTELGGIGNLQVKGPNVFHGYWNLPEKTAEDFTDDGFFNTGDKASIDEQGYVSIVGRAKDMVISGGLNVYPKEVELLIDDLSGVSESAVIGVPHADFGEAVVAVVVLSKTNTVIPEKQIIDYCRDNIATFKTPKRVMFVEQLPRNTMGKVQKNILRERYCDLFE